MKLVAIARAPARPEEAAKALADASGVALAEARMRLAPEPPALLARLEPERADALVASLRKAGLAALAVDVRCPTDRDRTVARSCTLDDSGATFAPRSGGSLRTAWPDLLAILRGLRASRSEVERTEKSKGVSVGEGVWMGAGVKVLDGDTIGDGAVVGANAVVRGDVPDHAIAVGVPAKVYGTRGPAR